MAVGFPHQFLFPQIMTSIFPTFVIFAQIFLTGYAHFNPFWSPILFPFWYLLVLVFLSILAPKSASRLALWAPIWVSRSSSNRALVSLSMPAPVPLSKSASRFVSKPAPVYLSKLALLRAPRQVSRSVSIVVSKFVFSLVSKSSSNPLSKLLSFSKNQDYVHDDDGVHDHVHDVDRVEPLNRFFAVLLGYFELVLKLVVERFVVALYGQLALVILRLVDRIQFYLV
ncbi:hypothetical protein CVS40_2979 [Lucilia cuprina]|nr:hypothetical protein CVS40_2979 [Lucilia cuprina]